MDMKILAVIIVALIAVCWLVAIPQTYRSKRNGKYVVSFFWQRKKKELVYPTFLQAYWRRGGINMFEGIYYCGLIFY